jgi:nucleotide-binding universal stress UspA family protein
LVTALSVLAPRQELQRGILATTLDRTRSMLARSGVEVQTILAHGDPAGELVQYASDTSPDLIVLGAQGLRATLGIFLGGVAQQVVEYATQPVLIVRAPYNGLHRALLVTDGSTCSEKAVNYLCGRGRAACLPLPAGTELRLAHVMPPLLQPDMYVRTWPVAAEAFPYIDSEELEAASRRQAEEEEKLGRQILDTAASAFRGSPGWVAASPIETVLLRGDAASEIIQYSKQNAIDLVIAGSRGLSQVRSWLLGSVSRKLVHYAGCSVLVVK